MILIVYKIYELFFIFQILTTLFSYLFQAVHLWNSRRTKKRWRR